jgi:sulfur carrier protein ThiS adenylyltransferase
MGDLQNRYIRQKDLVPAERLETCKATVIGVGAIGRQVALQLAAIGVPSLQLIDFDSVEIENLSPQGYLEEDLGRPKVEATADLCRRVNSTVVMDLVPKRFGRSMKVGNVVFLCVDSIVTRKLIYEALKDRVSFLADTRMSAEVVRILAVVDAKGRQHYPTTLFGAEEAQGGACTAKSTIYTASIAAGLAVGEFTKYLRGLPVDLDLSLNILTAEMSCV